MENSHGDVKEGFGSSADALDGRKASDTGPAGASDQHDGSQTDEPGPEGMVPEGHGEHLDLDALGAAYDQAAGAEGAGDDDQHQDDNSKNGVTGDDGTAGGTGDGDGDDDDETGDDDDDDDGKRYELTDEDRKGSDRYQRRVQELLSQLKERDEQAGAGDVLPPSLKAIQEETGLEPERLNSAVQAVAMAMSGDERALPILKEEVDVQREAQGLPPLLDLKPDKGDIPDWMADAIAVFDAPWDDDRARLHIALDRHLDEQQADGARGDHGDRSKRRSEDRNKGGDGDGDDMRSPGLSDDGLKMVESEVLSAYKADKVDDIPAHDAKVWQRATAVTPEEEMRTLPPKVVVQLLKAAHREVVLDTRERALATKSGRRRGGKGAVRPAPTPSGTSSAPSELDRIGRTYDQHLR
jgi:hypothetical protein